MRYHKYLLLSLIIYVHIAACKKDFLNVVDNVELTRQGYVKDLGSMNEFLNGTYGLLNQYCMDGIGDAYPEISADNLRPLDLPPQFLFAQYTWSQQKGEDSGLSEDPFSLNMNSIWQGSYFIIRTCNFIIENVDKYRDENPSKADNIKGQAYALRAFLHFKLVNVFAQTYTYTSNASHLGVPYITTSHVTKPYIRQTVSAVYDNMVSDLKNAIQLLPETSVDARYMNNYAARAMLSRVYLFKRDYVQSRAIADVLCKQIPLLTIEKGYPDALFNYRSFKETEVLFQATPSDIYSSSFLGMFLRGTTAFYIATNDLASFLQSDSSDVRFKWVTKSNGLWNVTKFPTSVAGMSSIPAADYYHPLVRSSEVYLNAAESCAMMGDEDNARNYINAIVKRANPAKPSILEGGDKLIALIKQERRKELAFEGLRMYDLQRWNEPVIRKDLLNSGWKELPYPSSKAIAPIPLQDVKLNNLVQNEGY